MAIFGPKGWVKPFGKKSISQEKWRFLDQKHALTPLEKREFSDFLHFFFIA